MKPEKFVQQVLHAQEGVLLDPLYPSDDLYREVMTWLHHVLDEFVELEDWSFLRESLVLGPTDPEKHYHHKVPKFILPDNVYRPSSLFGDSLKLHRYRHHDIYDIDENDFIEVPFVSKGYNERRKFLQQAKALQARNYGNYIEFNRSCIGNELRRSVVCDCQMKPHYPHICDDTCKAEEYKDASGKKSTAICYDRNNYHPCKHIEKEILTEFPNTLYFIFKTAYYNSMSSPIAQAAKMDLDNSSKQLLSNLRKVDSAKTYPDNLQQESTFIPYSVF